MATSETRFRIEALVLGKDQIESLRNAVRQLNSAVTPASQDIDQLRRAANLLGQASNKTENDLRTQINVLRDLRSQVKFLGQDYRELTKEITTAQRQLDKGSGSGQGRFKTVAETAGAIAASGVFGGPEGAIGAGIGAFAGPGGALAGGAIGAQVGQIRKAIGEFATYSAEISKLDIALKGLTKTQTEYSAAQGVINSIVNDFNVPVKEATSGFTRLTASVIGAGGNVRDSELVFRGVSSAIKATGGSAEDVQAAITAMSQVFGKGKVSAEELQGQLGERLPGAVTKFAQATGRTGPELAKALEQGQVGLNDLMKFVIALSKEYDSSAKTIADSQEEAGARMKISLDALRQEIGKTFQPLGASFQNSLADLADNAVSELKKTQDAIAVFNDALKPFKDLLVGTGNAMSGLTNILPNFFTSFNTALAQSIPVFGGYIQQFQMFLSLRDRFAGKNNSTKDLYGRYAAPEAQVSFTQQMAPTNFAGPKPSGAAAGGGSGGGSKKQAESLAAQIANALKPALNLTDAQAAGIVGNLIRESKLNPRINEGGAVGLPRMVGGYGLAQWTGSRQQDLISFAGGKQQAGDLGTQLRFIVKELLGPESGALDKLRTAQSPEQAAVVFDKYYERSGVKAIDERKQNARNVFNEIAKFGPGSGLKDFASQLIDQQKELEKSIEAGDKIIQQLERQVDLSLLQTDSEKELQKIIWDYQDRSKEIQQLQDAGQRKRLEALNTEYYMLETQRLQTEELAKQNKIFYEKAGLDQRTYGGGGDSGMLRTDLDLLGQQKTALDGVLEKYPQIGQAASAAAQLVSQSVSGMINGTQNIKEAFSNFLKSISDMLIETAQKMIAQYIAIGIAKMFAGLGSATGGLGAAGSAAGSAAFGSGGSGILGFQLPKLFANGGIMTSKGPMPLRSYAKGGIANSPQLAMFGEGRTPEAFVPLPDGRRIPVAMSMGGGKTGLREAMGGGSGGSASAPMLNMSFETTKFGDTEYVSRDQLEAAMAATRRQASRDGAKRGMTMTLDKLQQSPGTRSRVGIR